MSSKITETYSKIFSQLEDLQADSNSIEGFLHLTDEIVEDLRRLENAGLTSGTYKFLKGNKPIGPQDLDSINEKFLADDVLCNVDLETKKIHSNFVVCLDWDDLLSYEDSVKAPVESVFFTATGECISDNSSSDKFTNYQNISKVFQLIQKLANETDGGERTIFYERALTFDFTLSESDLEHAIDLEVLNKILNKDLHKEAITCLLCKELVSFLKDVDVKKRFSYLIQHLSSLIFNVQLSYQGYVENYTFDKVRKEYQEKRSEYTNKVYDKFDNVATKLLSLPAGIWFATTQIEPSTFGSMEFAKNVTVLVTVASLVVILVFSLYSQYSNLEILKKEYVSIFDQLAVNFEDEAADIRKAKEEILSAETKVLLKLGFSIFIALVLFGLTFWLFCKAYN
ncbi:hypothetical protein V6260_04835 [Pseudoalteromonas aliena]|uniref:hypothetical protein n=1 Tax=Pseudoalteromonas aliena TaxID=247523 RepID=UPI00311D5A56